MAGGSLITRLYDFMNGMVIQDFHLDGELDKIHQYINGKLGDQNIASDADIQGTKVKTASMPLNRIIEAVYTKAEMDLTLAAAALGTAPDRSVLGIKLALGAISDLEINTSKVASKAALDSALKWSWINL